MAQEFVVVTCVAAVVFLVVAVKGGGGVLVSGDGWCGLRGQTPRTRWQPKSHDLRRGGSGEK